MGQDEVIQYWLHAAQETKISAEDTLANKHPEWGFFLYHLALEKLIKGLIVVQGNVPIPSHDLVKLCKAIPVALTSKQEQQLREITSYNIEARYDDYKLSYYKKVTKIPYIKEWANICQELFLWFKTKY